jgi:hypothetical protein
MEGPEFRIVGNISPEEKEKEKERIIDQLHGNHLGEISEKNRRKLEMAEYPKTEQELALIDLADEKTIELMDRLGVKSYSVPERNLHIVPTEIYDEFKDSSSTAMAIATQQAIFFNVSKARRSNIQFGRVAYHEMLHLKAHLSMEVNDDVKGNRRRTSYRLGVGVESLNKNREKDEEYEYFHGLHEAIVSYQEKLFIPDLYKDESVKDEVEWMQSDKAKELIKKESARTGIDESDYAWISENGDSFSFVSYDHLRNAYLYILGQIQLQFPDRFSSVNEVHDEFLKAHFTGHLLGIGKLVDGTFGPGSFRVLGMMNDKNTTIQTSKYLKGARLRVEKKEESD